MAFVGRTDVKDPGAGQQQWERLAARRERLYTDDAQFRDARPDEAVAEKVRAPGLRIAEAMATVMTGYANRPALGQRAREVVTDPATGTSTLRLLPRFETLSYGESRPTGTTTTNIRFGQLISSAYWVLPASTTPRSSWPVYISVRWWCRCRPARRPRSMHRFCPRRSPGFWPWASTIC